MTPFGVNFIRFLSSIKPESRLRLAPTPSGLLHAGNACNFILNWLAARWQPGSRLLLRIDDLDVDRKRPQYVQDVFDTLHWLSLDWDEGPRTPEDFEKKWSQKLRIRDYEALLNELRVAGFLFACQKSRRELAPFQGHYPLSFRAQNLDLEDQDVAWRIKTPRSDTPAMPEDFVVRRRDGLPAYQIASLADDLHFGITHIIRGQDLVESTAAQLFLAACLGRKNFTRIKFLHHPLLLDDSGSKLSKSAGALSFRVSQPARAELFQYIATWLGMPRTAVHTADELLGLLRDVKI